jgi:hypothetical protein
MCQMASACLCSAVKRHNSLHVVLYINKRCLWQFDTLMMYLELAYDLM